jgi:hypothetical protein
LSRRENDAQEDPDWESGSYIHSEPEAKYLDFGRDAIFEDTGGVTQAIGPYGKKQKAPHDDMVVVKVDSDSDADAMSE